MNSKRTFDLFAAALGLLLLAPVLAMVALIIVIDSPGTALFVQDRVGKDGTNFRIIKFRSMTASQNVDSSQLTIGNDRRVTKLGFLLRKWKVDELPQLWNVLIGDMSIVGPRPEVPKYVAYYPSEIRNIVLSVRPGITDPCSLRLSNESNILAKADDPHKYYVETLLPKKLKIYVKYVNEQSFYSDLQIIFQTFFVILLQKNRTV